MVYPLIILGGGGHAKVLVNTLQVLGRQILGYVDPAEHIGSILGTLRLGDDESVFQYPPANVRLVNAVGSIKSTGLRKKLFERFSEEGYVFETVVHPSSVVASDVGLGAGAQVMAGVVVQPGTTIGADTIINTSASVDHDCAIGAHVHIAPGVVLSGGVRVEDGAHVGTGANIIQGVSIGANSVIGAGAVVLNDVPAGATAVGVPARLVREEAAVLELKKTNG